MAGVRDHTELDTWKLCVELERQVAGLLARPGFRRHPRLHEQLTNSSEGPGPNLAEGFSRYHPRENAPFVRMARGSVSETIAHLHQAHAKGLIGTDELAAVTSLARRARGAATRYLEYLERAPSPRPARPRNQPRDQAPPTPGAAGTEEPRNRNRRTEEPRNR